jgi:beta-lactamase class A
VVADIRRLWSDARCEGALHVRRLPDGPAVEVDADRRMVLASVFKVAVALEFHSRVADGDLDGTRMVTTRPASRTPGVAGLSIFRDEATVSLRDLAYLMLSVSDNAATDELIAAVGLDAVNARLHVCGCRHTRIECDLAALLDGVGRDLGFADYSELLDAQAGRLGPESLARSTDQERIGKLSALDPEQTTSSTPRDMTTLLAAIAADTAGPPEACGLVRNTMSRQVGGRLVADARPGVEVAAKGGSLFGRVYNEIALVTVDGAVFAVAVLTRADRPFVDKTPVNRAIASAAFRAIDAIGTSGAATA